MRISKKKNTENPSRKKKTRKRPRPHRMAPIKQNGGRRPALFARSDRLGNGDAMCGSAAARRTQGK